MPNIAKMLKQEISRLARKEAKALVGPARKPTAGLRRAVAALKRRIAALERATRQLQVLASKIGTASPGAGAAADAGQKARITAKGMRSLRRKLGLSQGDMGKLVGVTRQAVVNLEKKPGGLKVRSATRAAILAARGMGAREAQKRLAELAAVRKPKAKKAARKQS